MIREETDRTIHETMGLCWHEWVNTNEKLYIKTDFREELWGELYKCKKCHKEKNVRHYDSSLSNPSYTSNWQDYKKSLTWLQKQEWWFRFVNWIYLQNTLNINKTLEVMLNPLLGSLIFVEFIKAHPELFKKEE